MFYEVVEIIVLIKPMATNMQRLLSKELFILLNAMLYFAGPDLDRFQHMLSWARRRIGWPCVNDILIYTYGVSWHTSYIIQILDF